MHVIYAYPSDGVDRFLSLAGEISRDIAAIDTWWRAQDPLRAPRWDLAAFPGCDTPFGSLDITAVKLQRLDSWYTVPDNVLTRLSGELAALPTTLRDREKKYLVLYDGRPGKFPFDAIICSASPSSYIFGGTHTLPTGPIGLTMSSNGKDVELSWQPASSPNGPVTYRFTRDGVLINTPSVPFAADHVDSGSTHTWTVRAEDSLGLLGPVQEIRYTFTAAPAIGDARSTIDASRHGIARLPVTGLHARATPTGIELAWSPSQALPAAASFRVAHDGKLFAQVTHSTSLAVLKTKTHGSWVVYAVGGYGAVSAGSAPLRVA